MNSYIALSPRELRKAADLKERIDSLQAELLGILGQTTVEASGPAPRKRTLSAATIARIRAGARARWARARRAQGGAARTTRKPSRRMSAAAKARLAAIARERWRKVKAQGRNAL